MVADRRANCGVVFPQFEEEVVDVVRLVPQERVQQIDEQIMKVPIPHLLEDSVGEFKIVPQSGTTGTLGVGPLRAWMLRGKR